MQDTCWEQSTAGYRLHLPSDLATALSFGISQTQHCDVVPLHAPPPYALAGLEKPFNRD